MSRNEDNPHGVSVYRPSARSLSTNRHSRSSFFSTAPRSRSSSRGNSTNRASIVDMYKQQSLNNSTASLRREPSVTAFSGALGSLKIRRWDALKRTTTTWDSLRRDPELWFPGGDCFVHFYDQGQSRRGPSLRVSLADVEASNCRPLLERYLANPVPDSPTSPTSSDSSDGGFYGNPNMLGKHELYIPAPAHLKREEAFQYHLTTRNFFAWMFEKPLVGARLGVAAVSLLERMNEYRPDMEENEDDVLAYMDGQGYTDFRECPDHALAVLHFAEKFRYRDLWIDAFVHCVGMNSTLINSSELDTVSRTTKALITRSRLEMDLRIDHADDSLGTFLEEELSSKYMALPNEAIVHLERFRSFLQSFYVQQYGYWPPTQPNKRTNAFSRSVLRSMYFDFRSLYDYLVDTMSSCSLQDSAATDGGICTLQNVTAFDRRYKLTSLPHPLPLIPDASTPALKGRPSTFAKLFNSKKTRNERKMASLCALAASTNCEESTVMESALVREYFRFEREWVIKDDERISSLEARKVRWILVYAMLQTLISVTRAPVEVRDTEGVSYPLCCQTAGTPPWGTDSPAASSAGSGWQTQASTATSTTNSSTVELRPDPDCLTPAIINATRRTLFTLSTTSTTALPMVPVQPVSPLTTSSTYTTRPSTPTSVYPTSKSRSRRTSISSIATTIASRRTARKTKSFGDLAPPTPSSPTEPVPELPHLDIKAPQPRRASAQIFVGNCDHSTCSLPSPTRTAPPPPPESQSPSPSSTHSNSTNGDWSAKDCSSDDGFDMDHHSLCSDSASEHKRTKSLSPPPLQINKAANRPSPPLVLKKNPTQEELPSRRPLSTYTVISVDLPSPGLSQKSFNASLLACEPTSYAPVPLTASNALNSHPVSKSRGAVLAPAPASTRSRSPAPSVSSTIRDKGKKLRSKFSMDSIRGREGRNPEVGEYLRGISRMSTRDVGDEWGRF